MADLEKELEAAKRKNALAKEVLQKWVDKKGHDKCWYYPEIFRELCEILEVVPNNEPELPAENEFENFCGRYRGEVYTGKEKYC